MIQLRNDPQDSGLLNFARFKLIMFETHTQPGPSCSNSGNAIEWMRLYPLDKDIRFPNTYPLDIVIY